MNTLEHSFAVIILAAGRGTRMGTSARPKLLLPWRDHKPILWHTIETAISLQPSEVVVVVRPDLPEIQSAISGLPVRCVANPHYSQGMATSLAAGIRALHKDTQAALLMLGDEPSVDPRIVQELVAAYLSEGKPVTIPQYGEHVGPPTLFARSMFPELVKLEGDIGGRQIVSLYPHLACRVPFDEAMRPQDVDTEEDYLAIL